MAISRTAEEVALIIEQFLDGRCGDWDWDDFLSIGIQEPELETVRRRCSAVWEEYPSGKPGEYCNADGLAVLRQIAQELRSSKETT